MASTRSFASARSMIVSAKLGLVRTKNPSDADDKMPQRGGKRSALARKFGRAVVAKRARDIFLDVRCGLRAIKNIVRAEMDKTRSLRCSCLRHDARSAGVYDLCFFPRGLAAVQAASDPCN